jgi:hypothetical protein
MRARHHAAAALKGVGATGRKAAGSLVDRVLLTEGRVVSALEGKRLLTEPEARAERIQRGLMIAVPVARMLARGARVTRTPWVMVGSSSISIGTSVHTGVRELKVLTSLLAHRLEESTPGTADPRLVEKLAIDLYLHPKRTLDLSDDKLRLVRLTRKWVFAGALGRTTAKRAGRALDAAERVDPEAASAQWAARQSRRLQAG